MAGERTCQFLVQVAAAEDDLGGPEAVEEFALALSAELAQLEVTRIERVPPGPAPEGARAVEVIAALGLLMTAVQTVAALPAVVAAIKQLAAAYTQRRKPVKLTVAGIEIDPLQASDREIERVVSRLMELPGQTLTGTRSALVVATARYEDRRLAQLRSPGQDAQALARVLGDPAIGGFHVDLLLDADERTIRRRTAAFLADRDRDDVLLLHFSCHGVKDLRGRLHLAARDTDLSVLGATGIPASFVNDLLAETQSRRVVLMLDCCYSGAFARGARVRAGSEVHVADELGAGTGCIVLTASSATEYAFEGGELTESQASPSAFTAAVVAGLESGEADLDADGEISIDELYDYTYRTVRQTTPGQAPMKWGFGVEGSLVIARSVRPAALPAWITEDLLSDRVALRLEAVRGLSEILSGGKPSLRASAIGALTQLRDDDDSVRVRGAAMGALAAATDVGGVDATAGKAGGGTAARGTAPGAPPMAPSPQLPVDERSHAPQEHRPPAASAGAPQAPQRSAWEAASEAPPASQPQPPPASQPQPPPATPPASRQQTPPGTRPATQPHSPAWQTTSPGPQPPAGWPQAPPSWPQAPPNWQQAPPSWQGLPQDPGRVTGGAPAGRAEPGASQARIPTSQGEVDDRLAGRQHTTLAIVGGSLVLLSLLLYLVGASSAGEKWWTVSLAWLSEPVAALLLLGTRRARWAGALVGLLAWELLYSGVILFGHLDLEDGPVAVLTVANIIVIAALVCLAIGAGLVRPRFRALGARRIAGTAVTTVLALAAVILAANVAWEVADLDDGDSTTVAGVWMLAASVVCALILPAAGLVARRRAVAPLAQLGWLLGGLPFAIVGASELYPDSYANMVAWLFILLFAAAGTAAVTSRSVPDRSTR